MLTRCLNDLVCNRGFPCASLILENLVADIANVVLVVAIFRASNSLGFNLGHIMTELGKCFRCNSGLLRTCCILATKISRSVNLATKISRSVNLDKAFFNAS